MGSWSYIFLSFPGSVCSLPCSHNVLGQCPEPWLWKQACSSCKAGPDSQNNYCLWRHICLKTLVYIPILSFLFIFVGGETEAGVTVWFEAWFSQGINCLSFCWHFPSAEKINSWSSLVLFSMEPGRGIPLQSNIHELAHLIKLFKGKHVLAELLLKPLQSVGCSVITWSPASPAPIATGQLLGPAGEESPYSSGKVRWGEQEGKAAPPQCRHSAFGTSNPNTLTQLFSTSLFACQILRLCWKP